MNTRCKPWKQEWFVSLQLLRCKPDGAHSVVIRTMKTPVRTSLHQFAPVRTSLHQFAPVCTSLHQFAPFKAVFSCGGRNLCCSLYFIASGLHSCWIPLPRSFVTFRVMKFLYLLIALQIFQVISDTFWKYSGVICETVSSIPRNIYCFIGRR